MSGERAGDHPMDDETPQRRQCKAKNRAGERCKRAPMRGGMVCRMHGGAAPQTKRKASLRLLELIDPAIATLAREMTTAEKSADKQRAANSILDRAGMPRRTEVVDAGSATDLLIERIRELREEAGLPPEPSPLESTTEETLTDD